LLEPGSGRTASVPKPTKLLSKLKLREAWSKSRDSTASAGRPGIDGITAQNFAANLDANLNALSKRLRTGDYGPSRLKSVFIPKENSTKERMICIPSVADRLVQRAIVRYLVSNKILPIYNSSSFGFIEGLGTPAAIRRTIELRDKYPWCLKTDIETFFDSIQRPYLKSLTATALGRHSLVPIIFKIIDCEIKLTPRNKEQVHKQGIKMGVGLRQGMPLSPILANLALSKFDREVSKNRIEMVRYADDLLLFFPDENAAHTGHQLIKAILKAIELSIPEIEDGSKTIIVPPRKPVDFLGRQIAYITSESKYVARVSDKKIAKIKQQIKSEYAFESRSKIESTLQETIVELWQSISAYLGAYKDAHNFPKFEGELRQIARATISKIFLDIFGENALGKLTSHQKNFLGIGHLDFPEALNDIDL
jgi:group II intron reverse transcriptase/maturase